MNKKWLFSLIFILVLSLVITGCANDAEEPNDIDPVEEDIEEDLDQAEDSAKDAVDEVEDAAEDAKDKADETVKDIEDDIRDMTYEDIKITAEEAFDIFTDLHSEAKVKEIDLDKELMEYQYVIEGYDSENEYEVKINPINGEIISDDIEPVDLDDEDGEINREILAKVESIIEKAIQEDGSDSRLDEWNISVDDGRIVMEIEIGATEYEYDMETEELIERDM